MKTYKFTTKNQKGEEIKTYEIESFNINEAKKYAKNILSNSRWNETSHSRIKLVN